MKGYNIYNSNYALDKVEKFKEKQKKELIKFQRDYLKKLYNKLKPEQKELFNRIYKCDIEKIKLSLLLLAIRKCDITIRNNKTIFIPFLNKRKK